MVQSSGELRGLMIGRGPLWKEYCCPVKRVDDGAGWWMELQRRVDRRFTAAEETDGRAAAL